MRTPIGLLVALGLATTTTTAFAEAIEAGSPSVVSSVTAPNPRHGFTLDTQLGLAVVERPGLPSYATATAGIGFGLWITPRFALRARVVGADYLFAGPEAEFALPGRLWLACGIGAYAYDDMTTELNGWQGGLGTSFRAGFNFVSHHRNVLYIATEVKAAVLGEPMTWDNMEAVSVVGTLSLGYKLL